MNKKIIISMAVLSAMALDAEMLKYSILGYDNALKNGWPITSNHDAAVKACFDDNKRATDKIQGKYPGAYFNHIKGDVIEICNYMQLTQYNDSNRYIVYCGNVEKGFEDISKADGYNDKLSQAYSISVRDNKYDVLDYNDPLKVKYDLKHHKKVFNVYTSNGYRQKIDIIEDGYKLLKTNTTGRVKVENNGGAIGYLLDQSPMIDRDNTLKPFYNIIVGSQYREKVALNKTYQSNFNAVRDLGVQYTSNPKFKEKALLKNIKAVEYIGYLDYPIPDGNEGKCYTFDITRFDRTNTGDDPIRAKNFLWDNGANYYFKGNETKNYSIHKSNSDRKGVYEHTGNRDYQFSLNLRAGSDSSMGEAFVTFYPDANRLEVENKRLHLKDGNEALEKRENNEYYVKHHDGSKCYLRVDSSYKKELVLKLGSCKLDKGDITIYESGNGFDRPIFQESGRDIVKGTLDSNPVAEELVFKTAYVDDANNSVIKNNKINPDTKYGDAIYTTLVGKDFYVQLDGTSEEEIYVDFSSNGSFTIDSVYNENGIINKTTATANDPCGDKYPLQKMIVKLKAKSPSQINSLGYTQYTVGVKNGQKVCQQLDSEKGSSDFKSNDFAIRPEYFETTPKDSIIQEAGKTITHDFSSKELANYNGLKIGFSEIELKDDDLNLIGKNGENVSFKVDKAQDVNVNGGFNLDINFPVATEVKLNLAETSFAENDKTNGYCIGNESDFSKDTANTSKNGKIHCYIPVKEKINVTFTSTVVAQNKEYSQCSESDIEKCDNYNPTTGKIEIDTNSKIGIKNPVYDKLMVGDANGLVYTLSLISVNSDNNFVPTKYTKPLMVDVKLKVNDANLLNSLKATNNDEDYQKTKVSDGEIYNLDISTDKLNEKYKNALKDLLGKTDVTLSSMVGNYTEDDVKYENVTTFAFDKNKITPLQKVQLEVNASGADDYKINLVRDYDVAYTGLLFKDVKADKGNNVKSVKFKTDYVFGYYDSNYNFVNDSANLKEKNIDNKVMFNTTYSSTKVSANEFTNTAATQYIKDSIKFYTSEDYLNNSKNIFTIEFIK